MDRINKQKNVIVYIAPDTCTEGASLSLIALMSFLKNSNYLPVAIIPKHGDMSRKLDELEIEYVVCKRYGWVNHRSSVESSAKYLFNIGAALYCTLVFKIKKYKPLFIHSNTICDGFGVVLSKLSSTPHVQHIREIPTEHFLYTFDFGIKRTVGFVDRRSQYCIAISKAVKDFYSKLLPEEHIEIINNGVPIPEYQYERDNNSRRIVLVGRIDGNKGHLDVILAVKDLFDHGYKDLIVDFYGEGDKIHEYNKLVDKLSLNKNVFFKGYNSHIPFHEYYLGIMGSRCEAFGRTTIEYMLNGLPVVGTNSGGTPELIDNGINGLLYNFGDYKALANDIRYLFENKTLAEEMGKKGKEKALSHYDERQYCNNVLNSYKRHALI